MDKVLGLGEEMGWVFDFSRFGELSPSPLLSLCHIYISKQSTVRVFYVSTKILKMFEDLSPAGFVPPPAPRGKFYSACF